MKRFQTAHFAWRLIAFRPWLFWANCLSIIMLFVAGYLFAQAGAAYALLRARG